MSEQGPKDKDAPPSTPRDKPASSAPKGSGEHPAVVRYHEELRKAETLSDQIQGGHPPTSPPPPPPEQLPPAVEQQLRDYNRHMRTLEQASILVVDDDRAIREALAGTLVDEGYLVTTARHALEGLNELDRLRPPPDVILLDLWMPDYDGWSFMGFVERTKFAKIPIIIITASGTDSKRPPLTGADDRRVYLDKHIAEGGEVIAKPWKLDHLLATIQKWVDASRDRRNLP